MRPDGIEHFSGEVNDDEWIRRWKVSIHDVVATTQQLVDALEDAIDPESEAAAYVRAAVSAANAKLDDYTRAMREREDPRPLKRRRIRAAKAA